MPRAARSSPALALVLLVAACSGGGSSSPGGSGSGAVSRAQYVAQATRICRSYQRRISSLKSSTDLTQLAVQGRRAVALETAELHQLRGLATPVADRQAIARMLAGLQSATDAGAALVNAAQAGNAAEVSAAADQLRARLTAATRLAKPFGLDLCAR